jgi:lipoprotein-anchoring transpeptidase ErfK/SrfK
MTSSTGAAVRLHRNAVRHRPDSLSAFKWKACPPSPESADNPLGARALYLGGTMYRIHGSNEPHAVGTGNTSGCIRLTNDDVIDLYDRVKVGATVIVQR